MNTEKARFGAKMAAAGSITTAGFMVAGVPGGIAGLGISAVGAYKL